MKYIRTKDRIFDETEHRHTIRNGKVSIMGIFYEFKQADTIEELCDCYFYENEIVRDVVIARSWKNADKNSNIYGLIKTDKGLICVAKMNEKGELELL